MPEIIRRANEADVTFHNETYETGDLKVVRFEGTEGISELYRFVLEVSTDDPNLDLGTLVGKPGALLIRGVGDVRRVMGQVARAEHAGVGVNQARYVLEIVPSVWYLTLRQTCRMFFEMKAGDIISQVLADAGIPSNGFDIQASHCQTREYCVQYRESDWDFICRLMEEEGIFYFFKHEEDGEVLTAGAVQSIPVPIADPSDVKFHDAFGHQQDDEVVHSFRFSQSIRPAGFTHTDYDFKKPKLNLQTNSEADSAIHSNLQIFDYPGAYVAKDAGDPFAQHRIEELRAFALRGFGEGNVKRLTPGFKVTFEDHARDDLNREYLITRVVHRGTSSAAAEEEGGGGNDSYLNTFEVIPSDVPFRPARITPRPVVHGVQTAVVAGASGEEIYTDEFGRVKVRFHWDRAGDYGENSSCWIRVSQAFAGGQYGAIFTPRVGQEVIVEFIEGNPDRQIITGRVYNAEQKVPYPLPDEKTKSTIKTNSSTGGGGFNEIRFEDKAGEEQLFIHAQKEMDMRVLNDRREWIGNDRALIVENDRKTGVANDDELTVSRDRKEQVDRDLAVTAGRDLSQDVGRDHNLKVGGKQAIKVSESYSHDVGGDVIEKYGGAQSTDVTTDVYIKGGVNVVIEAGVQLTLKVGANFVSIGAAGVDIVGTMVNINSGGSAGSGSAGSPVSPAAPATPGEVPEAGDDEPGTSPTFSGGAEVTDPLELQTLNAPWHNESAEHQGEDQKTWVEIELLDGNDEPVSGEKYRIILPDGETVDEGTLGSDGKKKIDNIDPGQCRVIFPDLDANTWEKI